MNHPRSSQPSRRALIRAGGIGLLGLGVNHLAMRRDLKAAETGGRQPEPRADQ